MTVTWVSMTGSGSEGDVPGDEMGLPFRENEVTIERPPGAEHVTLWTHRS